MNQLTVNQSPDYQRGYYDGYRAGQMDTLKHLVEIQAHIAKGPVLQMSYEELPEEIKILLKRPAKLEENNG